MLNELFVEAPDWFKKAASVLLLVLIVDTINHYDDDESPRERVQRQSEISTGILVLYFYMNDLKERLEAYIQRERELMQQQAPRML